MSETPRYILCPYCGHPQPLGDKCNACGGLFEPLSRKATQISMGPWYIRDHNSPFRPGCSFQVLRKQIDAGRVKGNTVLRGPTTHQFWSVARNTPGVSHLLGYCHECNASVKPSDPQCPQCDVTFATPDKRNELGLLYPSDATAAKAQKFLDQEISKIFGPGKTASKQVSPADASQSSDDAQTRAPVQGGIDLLEQVLSTGASQKPKSSQASTPQASGSGHAHNAPSKPISLDFTPSAGSRADAPATRKAGDAGSQWKDQSSGVRPGVRSEKNIEPEAEPTAAVPSTGRSTHWLIWLLVASNIVVVGLLAAAIWLMKQPQS